jgi:hypothetical protein
MSGTAYNATAPLGKALYHARVAPADAASLLQQGMPVASAASLHDRSSTLHQIHEHTRCLYLGGLRRVFACTTTHPLYTRFTNILGTSV